MKERIITAAVGIAVALVLLFLGAKFPIVVRLSLTVITVFCVCEGLSAKKIHKKYGISVPCILFAVAASLFYNISMYMMPFFIYLFFVAIFLAMIFDNEKMPFSDLAYAVVVTFMCTFGLWTVVYMFDSCENAKMGLFYVVTALSTPWLADGGAYFGGSLFGKRKLCPKISPKKTVEGAVAGVVLGAVLSLLVGVVFNTFVFADNPTVQVSLLPLALYGLAGSLISIVGDLSFSLIKRNSGIKDFGDLMPGHGGMLDRFDSVIFSAPLLLFFNTVFSFFPLSAM
ncbi:MAG: phosphatidate cytidylyltransferase [Lachnospiraceae bacterium]|nr:phosphatidate cytidylyltransferase [Lachnospiraceae bacterium]